MLSRHLDSKRFNHRHIKYTSNVHHSHLNGYLNSHYSKQYLQSRDTGYFLKYIKSCFEFSLSLNYTEIEELLDCLKLISTVATELYSP